MATLTDNTLLTDIFPNKLISAMMPGDDDHVEDGDGDWTDIEDEDFEDMADDNDNLSEIRENNNIPDPDNDDHLPDEDI